MAMEGYGQMTSSEFEQLHAELAEVRAKRYQLDAMNLRVTDNLRRTIEEKDKAVAEVESLRTEYLKHKETANANSDQAASLREQLLEITAQRDAMERTADAMRVSRDEARKAAADLRVQLSQWQVGHDAAKEELARAKEAADMFEQENQALRDTVRTLRLKQIHPDLPGLLLVIQGAAEQARELI